MFDWILSWVYKAIGKAADAFVQNLVGDANEDGVLALKLSNLVESFPSFATLYEILQGFAIGLTIIIAAYSLIKFFVGGEQDQRDTPIATLIRSAIAGAAIYFGNYAVDLAVQAANAPYTQLWHANMDGASGETISMTDVAAAIVVGDAGILLSIIFLLIICWNLVKLFLEMFERLFMVGVLAYASPLAFATISSSATSQVFKKWSNMLISQLVLMSLTAWSTKLILSSMANISTIPGFLFVLAACRVAQRLDTYLQQLGLNTVTTGAGMIGEFAAAGYIARRALGGRGRGNGNSAPLGANLNNGAGPAPKSSYFGGVLGGVVGAVRRGNYTHQNGGTMQETVRAAGQGFMKGVNPFQRFKENAAERSQTVSAAREAAAAGAAAGGGGFYGKTGVTEEKPESRRASVINESKKPGDGTSDDRHGSTRFTEDFKDKASKAGMRPGDIARENLATFGAGTFKSFDLSEDEDESTKPKLTSAAEDAGLSIEGLDDGGYLVGPERSRMEFIASQDIESLSPGYLSDQESWHDKDSEENDRHASPYTVVTQSTKNLSPGASAETLFTEGKSGGLGRLSVDASDEARAIEDEMVNDLVHAGFDEAFARHSIDSSETQFSNFRKDVTDDRGSVITFTGTDSNGEKTDYTVADQAAVVSRQEFSRATTMDYHGLGLGKKGETEYGSVNIGGKNYAIIRNPQTKPRRFGKPSGYVPPKPPQRPDENKEIK